LEPLETQQGDAILDFKPGQGGKTRNAEETSEGITTFYTPTPPLDPGIALQLQTQDSFGRDSSSGGNQAREAYSSQQTKSLGQDFGVQSSGGARQKKGLPRAVLIAAVIILILGVGGYALYRTFTREDTAQTTDRSQSQTPAPTQIPAAPQSDMIFISGGTFRMGLDSSIQTDDYKKQTPAHPVTVDDFFIDRTEVTNAEYAEFVRESDYPPPKDWEGTKPPVGKEQWPVTNVSLDDAQEFAAWRSKRDNAAYRLPTEEEWEYAARGGERGQLFPWGNTWADDRANLGTGAGTEVDTPKNVGSYPQGATPEGVLDMIGNVYEWTSSRASYYPGNSSQLNPKERGYIVIRGGSHQSLHADAISKRGSEEFPATLRLWAPRDTKTFTVGFRLVMPVQDNRTSSSK
jgi:formylglycine-generating enzyme required for sulfatase activity